MLRWFKNQALQVVVSTAIGAIIFFAVFLVRDHGYMHFMEMSAYDLAIRNKPAEPIDDRIVVIGETEADIHRYGHPLSDDIFAQVLEKLTAAGAWSIGIDKYRDIPVPPGTERLKAVLQSNPDITWVFNRDIPPPMHLLGTDQIGVNDIPLDNDGIIRRGLLFTQYKDSFAYSFSLLMALRYLAKLDIYPAPDEQNPELFRLGTTTFHPLTPSVGSYINADAGGYQYLLDYSGMPARFTENYTLSDLLDDKIPRDVLEKKIIIFGAKAESLNDFFFTPFNRTRADILYGVELHGYITSQLLRIATKNWPLMKSITDQQEIWWLLAWCLVGTIIGMWLHTIWRFTSATLVGGIILIASYYYAFINSWWIPVVPPFLGFFLCVTLVTSYMRSQQKQERQMVMQLFAKHVSNAVAETIWEERDTFLDKGRLASQRVTATVLFTDIKGFTTVSENMDPQALMDWLNTYMDGMADVIIRHHGTINKYIGDAIMALFGAPLVKNNEEGIAADAVNAVDCALAMAEKLETMNKAWREQGLPEIGMRVGIYTGPLVAGSLGSSQRLEYTVIGDTVNTASRLESYKRPEGNDHPAEHVNCRILVGERTRNYLTDKTYIISHYGSVKLKGKTEEVDIYWVQAKQSNPSDSGGSS